MHIIIPMSGVGQRFIDAGYKDPKPLIQIDGKPIIEHVINLFPGETKFTFICNSTHLATTNMRQVLTACCPQGNIVEIPNHKLGPVYAVLQIADTIDGRGRSDCKLLRLWYLLGLQRFFNPHAQSECGWSYSFLQMAFILIC